jgi:HD-GYP domain-containing protein (c-di-GMP phosphodiesterase class II)
VKKDRAPRVSPKPADRQIEKVIFSYIPRIAAEGDIDRLPLLLADFGRDLVGADRCTVWVCDEVDGTLWSKAAHVAGRISIPKGKGLAGWVAAHGEPLIINDPSHDERFDMDADKHTGYLTRSLLLVPIKDADGRVAGVYQAVNKMAGSGGFSETDREHLQLAAAYTGEVLRTARLQEEFEATERRILYTMSEAGELRSRETGRHVRRVAACCRLLAQMHGLSESEAETLELSSPMHDIGMIAIPDSILLKPAKLDDAEWTVMKTHTTMGYNMLKGSERRLLRSATIIAWQHHEKWDGTGYPCGLAGEKIHIAARITAIADVFDVLSSDRPWRKAWALDRIVALFEAERGKHFDPELTRIFLEDIDEFVAIRDACG